MLSEEEAAFLLRRELDRLRSEPPPLLKIPRIKTPKLPQGVSPELAEASRNYSALTKAFLKAHTKAQKKKQLSFNFDDDIYWQKIEALIADDRKITADDLMAYRWTFPCGEGSEDFINSYSIAVLITLIREKRFTEAAGAALMISPYLHFNTDEFWEYLGFNLQMLFAGGIITSRSYPVRYFPEALADGSESGAKLLLQVAQFADPNYNTVPSALVKILETSNKSSSHPISSTTLAKIISLLDKLTNNNVSFHTTLQAASALRRINLPEARTILQRLYHHPSQRVSNEAAAGLRSLGETIADRPAPPPLSILFKVNGAPLIQHPLSLKIFPETEEKQTNTEGVLTFDREHLIDPTQKIKEIIIKTLDGNSPGSPLFCAVIPASKALNEDPCLVDVETKPINLLLSYPDQFKAPEGAELSMTISGFPEHSFAKTRSTFKTAISKEVRLGAIQPGDYVIEVRTPGTATYKSRVSLAGGTASIQLKRGADVSIQSIIPQRYHVSLAQLLRNGADFDATDYFNSETNTFRGLPKGDYLLTANLYQEPTLDSPKSTLRKTIKRRFRIGKTSPPAIDLGEIDLPQTE